MIPAPFEYASPETVEETVSLLVEHGDEAKVIAGGHSLLPLMKLRLAAPGMLIDLGRVAGLNGIDRDADRIVIGAMTRYAEVQSSDLVRSEIPLLAQVCGMVGDVQVRNRGTLGGALAHADPAGDIPTVARALGGEVIAAGPNGTRAIDLEEFFVDVFTSALEPDEILTEVRIRPQGEARGDYQKFRRRQIDWAIVGVAATVTRSNGSIADARVVLTNVGSTPVRARAVEDALRGVEATADAVASAAGHAADEIEPAAEVHATSDYKRHLARVLTRRALGAAIQ